MKIYQLHECGGEYEYCYNHIIGSYLKPERAEEEKLKAEAKEKMRMEHSKRCEHCPFIEYPAIDSISDLLAKYPDYCTEAKLTKDGCEIDCENFYIDFDECSFYIKEVEVEE